MSYTSKFTGAEIDARLDKMLNVTWQELKDLRDAGNLIAGQMYRMTDYETMTSKADTQSAGHHFDLVLTALDNKTLSEECSAVQSARDTDGYFASSNLSAWKVWYCLDNDRSRFGWAVKSGIIWEQGGQAITLEDYGPYTWNDTEYYAYRFDMGSLEGGGMTIWVYALYPTSTPSVGDTATYVIADATPIGQGIMDMTSEMNLPISSISTTNGKGVVYRLIDEKENDIPYDFKNIQFVRKITDGALDLENGTDTYCYTFSDFSTGTLLDASESLSTTICNKFGVQCWNNVFLGRGCYSNTFGRNCHDNTFGDGCFFNTFGYECYSNTFDSRCDSNTFGRNCYDNTFSDNCRDNTFGDNCRDNTFGSMCRSHTFGGSCNSNTFGDNCFSNTLEGSCSDNTFGDNCRYNTFGDYCRYITLNATTNHIHILNNISGTSSAPLTPNVATSKTYVQTVAYNSSGVLKVYCEADLVS